MQAAPEDTENTFDAGGEEGAGGEDGDAPASAPMLEFSLDGSVKAGWKKVAITSEHPYVRCLTNLIKQRVRQDVSSFRVDVDASLFTFKPKNQRALMRKLAEDVQSKTTA